ncbi:MAG: KamA family protein [Bacteroidales bacterium]|nr:KamA family protein [Bacteroidales bacterium]
MYLTLLEKKDRQQQAHSITNKLKFLDDSFPRVSHYYTFLKKIRDYAFSILMENPDALAYYRRQKRGRICYEQLRWKDFAAIRLLDYSDHEKLILKDPNRHGDTVVSEPLRLLWESLKGKTVIHPDFLEDFYQLFRQLKDERKSPRPSVQVVKKWMDRHPSGLDPEIIEMRKLNRDRILSWIIRKIEKGEIHDRKYFFTLEKSHEEKLHTARQWWHERLFHLRFAIRDPESLNEILNFSLPEKTMKILREARNKGIPFFINPYYLSLLIFDNQESLKNADLAIRAYMLYSRQLVGEFGRIAAWEKEDEVVPGQPNAAGWLLPPFENIHRRYPEVAILIPDSMGRACGGLCSVCQRMYDFQRGHLHFDLSLLHTRKSWPEKMKALMGYFRADKQLRDILITGGDALMSSDQSLEDILNAVYKMALEKKIENKSRPEGKKYAEILRVRLGTRLPAYLPQRITPKLVHILKEFREKTMAIGIRQFIIQTHFESAMEITPQTKKAVEALLSAGWMVTNQMVFTAAASRRGHANKLRKVLNDIGVVTYYTFSVKGFLENQENFATNARIVQEANEEKRAGRISRISSEKIKSFPDHASDIPEIIRKIREQEQTPFLATDRSVMNLPGVGKSLSFHVIGLTPDGRRILEFDHDKTRNHSPIIEKMGRIRIIESKSIAAYLRQMKEMGEDLSEYEAIFGYSLGETEKRQPVYTYPEYNFRITHEINNLQLES